ncbi:hypothetical protein FACS1894139_10330 [Planctomycetales bacterium]|nr:hypothetical protein FACS1894108_04850 [Planctomycetales bacterium]GHT05815.1 hypothetical protein FACS1894139_10330 [Planctomycetales bacterium]
MLKRRLLFATITLLMLAGAPWSACAHAADDDAPYSLALRNRADDGDVEAQIQIATAYFKGIGTPKNLIHAAKYLQMAAEQDDGAAQRRLGMCYEKGLGVEQDYVEAVKWYKKAAAEGDDKAKGALANLRAIGNKKAIAALNADEETDYPAANAHGKYWVMASNNSVHNNTCKLYGKYKGYYTDEPSPLKCKNCSRCGGDPDFDTREGAQKEIINQIVGDKVKRMVEGKKGYVTYTVTKTIGNQYKVAGEVVFFERTRANTMSMTFSVIDTFFREDSRGKMAKFYNTVAEVTIENNRSNGNKWAFDRIFSVKEYDEITVSKFLIDGKEIKDEMAIFDHKLDASTRKLLELIDR